MYNVGVTDAGPELWRLSLEARSGPDAGRSCVVDGDVVTVGKLLECNLVLSDPTVSRRHLRITRAGDGWVLADAGSTNGTFLAGVRVREAPIEAGAVFRAGQVEIAFVPERQQIDVEPWPDDHFGGLLGKSLAMRRLFGLMARVAETDATVLLQGETGTGKGAFARALHQASRRSQAPYVVVDCGAVQRQLVESELFGHEKGAFSGAYQQRVGAFEHAHGGTIFVDELGELELELQPKLLRVLDAREVRRIGGDEPIPVDLRVIAASRRDLAREVERGVFREDLYFRLSVVSLTIPPLRERAEDIPLLVEHFLQQAAEQRGTPVPRLAPETLDRLTSHDWPGNVRELRNTVERALLLSRVQVGDQLRVDGLAPRAEAGARPARPDAAFDPAASFQAEKERWVERRERAYLAWLMGEHEGNVSAAARAARMDRKYLHKLLRKHELEA